MREFSNMLLRVVRVPNDSIELYDVENHILMVRRVDVPIDASLSA